MEVTYILAVWILQSKIQNMIIYQKVTISYLIHNIVLG